MDEIDKFRQQDLKKKVIRIRELEAEKYLVEKEKELNKALKESMPTPAETAFQSGVDIAMAQELTRLPPEQQQQTIQMYAALKNAERSAGKGGDMLLPMMIGFWRQNPQATPVDFASYAKSMGDQIRLGMELARVNQPPQQPQGADAIQLLSVFANLIKDNVQAPFKELVEKLQPQPGLFEQILTNPDLFNNARNMGLFGGQTQPPTPPEVLVQLEKFRADTQMGLEKLRQDYNFKLLDRQADQAKWEMVGKALEGPLGKAVENLGGGAADRIRQRGGLGGATPPPSSAPAMPPGMMEIPCPQCNGLLRVHQSADAVLCPHCGTKLQKQQQPQPPPAPAPIPQVQQPQPPIVPSETEPETVTGNEQQPEGQR